MPTLVLYPFRFRDPLTGKWVRARSKMQVPELQRAYGEWEITGAPEMRHGTALSTAQYNPLGRGHRVRHDEPLLYELFKLQREVWLDPRYRRASQPSSKPRRGVSHRGKSCCVIPNC